jgi:hypothetical protein
MRKAAEGFEALPAVIDRSKPAPPWGSAAEVWARRIERRALGRLRCHGRANGRNRRDAALPDGRCLTGFAPFPSLAEYRSKCFGSQKPPLDVLQVPIR